jgi:hypothetical protein
LLGAKPTLGADLRRDAIGICVASVAALPVVATDERLLALAVLFAGDLGRELANRTAVAELYAKRTEWAVSSGHARRVTQAVRTDEALVAIAVELATLSQPDLRRIVRATRIERRQRENYNDDHRVSEPHNATVARPSRDVTSRGPTDRSS